MKIGNWEFENCNECPAYEWGGESINYGDYGMRCGFGAFSYWYDGKHPIPTDCPIRSSAVIEKVRQVKCTVCGWEGFSFERAEWEGSKVCPECVSEFEEE